MCQVEKTLGYLTSTVLFALKVDLDFMYNMTFEELNADYSQER